MNDKVIDLSYLLNEDKPTVQLGEKSYEINVGLKTVLMMDELGKKVKENKITQNQYVEEFLRLSFGKDKAKELMDSDYRMKVYIGLISAVKDALDKESIVSGNSENA